MTTPRITTTRPVPTVLFFHLFVFATLLFGTGQIAAAQDRIAIAADAGGAGHLANTLPALALAATSGIDFIELKLVATKDNELVVYHDLLLDPTTDVAELFPDRAREDGHYYVVDFNLDEIRRLRRVVPEQSQAPALGIPTFSEALSLLRALESELNTKVGIAPNVLMPQFHLTEKKDISSLTLTHLQNYGYIAPDQNVMLQSLDGDELQRIGKELMPEMQIKIPLLQLIDLQPPENEEKSGSPAQYDNTWMFTRLGLRVVSSYAIGIALHSSYLVDEQGAPARESYISDARALGLKIYAFPLEDNPPEGLPSFATTYGALLDHFYSKLRVDGVITTSPRQTNQYLQQSQLVQQKEDAVPADPVLPPPLPDVKTEPSGVVSPPAEESR